MSIELAGVSGPCPSCGQKVQSPAPLVEAASHMAAVVDAVPSNESVAAMPPRKLRPQPRPMRAKARNPVDPLMEPATAPRAVIQRNPGRAIHPVVGLSTRYDDQRETGSVIRVALAVLLTAGIVIAVTMFMTNQ